MARCARCPVTAGIQLRRSKERQPSRPESASLQKAGNRLFERALACAARLPARWPHANVHSRALLACLRSGRAQARTTGQCSLIAGAPGRKRAFSTFGSFNRAQPRATVHYRHHWTPTTPRARRRRRTIALRGGAPAGLHARSTRARGAAGPSHDPADRDVRRFPSDPAACGAPSSPRRARTAWSIEPIRRRVQYSSVPVLVNR